MADNVSITAGSGTSVATDDAGAAGHVQIVKLAISTDGSATAIPADAANGIDVDVTRLPAPFGAAGATSVAKAEDAASASADVGIPALAVRKATPANTSDTDGDYEMLQISAGRLWTSATLEAGSAAIGKLAANSGVDIGDVDVASLTGGTIAHDAEDSGNPIKVGARAAATLSDDTMVADADRTDLVTDLDGALITRPQVPFGDHLVQRTTNTDGAATALATFGATASAKNVIAWVVLCNSSASAITVDFTDGNGGTAFLTLPVPAGGGVVFVPPIPVRQPTANTGLYFDGSAAATTLTVSVGGYKTKV